MYKKLKKDKKEVRHVSEAAAPAYRADSHSESHNDYTNAGGHTSSESSRTAEFINVIVKSIMNNMENTIFDKLSTKIDAVDKKLDSKFTALEKSIADVYRNTDIKFAALEKKVDSNFISLTKSIESLETNMNTKFAAVDAKFVALETNMNTKFAAVDAKFAAVDAKFVALETNMNTKFEAVDVKISALDAKIDYKIDGVSNEIKLLHKLMFGGMTIILAAIFEPKITDLIMKLFGG